MKTLLVALVGLIAALALSCTQPTPTNITIVNNNTATNNTQFTIVFGEAVPSKDASCPAISRLRIEVPASVSIAAATLGQVSLTPLTAGGVAREARCDEADGALWSYPVNAFVLGSDTAFVTTIRGKVAGSYVLSVRVGDAAGSVPITVVL